MDRRIVEDATGATADKFATKPGATERASLAEQRAPVSGLAAARHTLDRLRTGVALAGLQCKPSWQLPIRHDVKSLFNPTPSSADSFRRECVPPAAVHPTLTHATRDAGKRDEDKPTRAHAPLTEGPPRGSQVRRLGIGLMSAVNAAAKGSENHPPATPRTAGAHPLRIKVIERQMAPEQTLLVNSAQLSMGVPIASGPQGTDRAAGSVLTTAVAGASGSIDASKRVPVRWPIGGQRVPMGRKAPQSGGAATGKPSKAQEYSTGLATTLAQPVAPQANMMRDPAQMIGHTQVTDDQSGAPRAVAASGRIAPLTGAPSADNPNTSSAGGRIEGDVYLDGALVGRWMSRTLAREAGRARSCGPAFDSRRDPLPVGRMIGG